MWDTATPSELKTLTDQIGHGVFVIEVGDDRRFRILSINQAVEQSMGIHHDHASGKPLEAVLAPATARILSARFRACVEQGRRLEHEDTLETPVGTRCLRLALTPILGANGKLVRIMGSGVDISAQQELQNALQRTAQNLRESEARLQLALRGAELGIWDWDVPGQCLHIVDAWIPAASRYRRLTRVPIGEWAQDVHPEDRDTAFGTARAALRGESNSYRVEYRIPDSNGHWMWIEVHGTVVEQDENGMPRRVCGTFRDISRRKRNQEALQKLNEELQHRAVHDSLTGVLNHGAILDALDKELDRAQRDGGQITVALIDVDHFKQVNDRYGHQAGDQVLQELVARIRGVLRPYDHLGRYGGEEFLVVAPSRNGIANLYERIRRAVAEAPFLTSAGPLALTVSIGVAYWTSPELKQERLLYAADMALYRAKHNGRNRVVRADDTGG